MTSAHVCPVACFLTVAGLWPFTSSSLRLPWLPHLDLHDKIMLYLFCCFCQIIYLSVGEERETGVLCGEGWSPALPFLLRVALALDPWWQKTGFNSLEYLSVKSAKWWLVLHQLKVGIVYSLSWLWLYEIRVLGWNEVVKKFLCPEMPRFTKSGAGQENMKEDWMGKQGRAAEWLTQMHRPGSDPRYRTP